MIIWFTGLSGSGKSTLSDYLKKALEVAGFSVCQVDGDVVRQKNKTHDKFSREHIIENNLGIIDYCQKIEKDYDFLIVAVISPYRQTRDKARQVFGKNYLEIFLNCPLEVLVKSDVKGLYEKAAAGEIKDFIGFHESSPYEIPKNPDLEIKTNELTVAQSIKKITAKLQESYGIKF
ncbi:MAG: adenylyl-sulfate kinase [Candidatus Staskawiczbacteria bacterium RIFCSPHIGHO2_02_FULL_43_16]|uniref:Adenylyl-sulfate kinase n=1 Tax=Candidatus Staskawiczbacteria bacterium RIFCSPHIGHO2_01_FULL_41_41 TaxID=1802203 RepID=A0A1G2HSJ0_9BACT|nr:MAG: adenylyl-sulfate kinase [Candidatus Staskawiczbacteria bacterium RIFCSPHIGHO2_01_FULL_41_41]OGZ68019.1 MAG: adenylyl-sulfate kinase [Candidatus Staskawiczbacteria bacterium RIFCSPHIGHO2_02_FULL_43_16]OGZ74584.1 MAG: adenylyl-sulfate kinase [Candidatus Staskawiczbacteria bacterium RIFCSPLOWO2_01_FULL_43_17b]